MIDDCEVPEALKSTIWERVQDTQNFGSALHRVLDSIFDRTDKPPLGPKPARVAAEAIRGLTGTDTLVLQAFYAHMVKTNAPLLQPEALFESIRVHGIGKDAFCESLLILGEKYLLEVNKAAQAPFAHIHYLRPTYNGFMTYAEHFLPQFTESVRAVALHISNRGTRANVELAEELQIQQFVLDYILEYFANKRSVTLSGKTISGRYHVMDISPSLKREFS